MNNKPVAWMNPKTLECGYGGEIDWEDTGCIPLYTHPAKELHLSLQKSKETGELLAVTYTDDEHRIVEVLWKKPPAKTLTDEEILVFEDANGNELKVDTAKWKLRKAQEK